MRLPILSLIVSMSVPAYAAPPAAFTATGSMTTGRTHHTATLLANGSVLVTGGFLYPCGGGGCYLSSAEIYDPTIGSFTATGSMATARANHTATLLPNGKVLVAGGQDSDTNILSSAELYDPRAARSVLLGIW